MNLKIARNESKNGENSPQPTGITITDDAIAHATNARDKNLFNDFYFMRPICMGTCRKQSALKIDATISGVVLLVHLCRRL